MPISISTSTSRWQTRSIWPGRVAKSRHWQMTSGYGSASSRCSTTRGQYRQMQRRSLRKSRLLLRIRLRMGRSGQDRSHVQMDTPSLRRQPAMPNEILYQRLEGHRASPHNLQPYRKTMGLETLLLKAQTPPRMVISLPSASMIPSRMVLPLPHPSQNGKRRISSCSLTTRRIWVWQRLRRRSQYEVYPWLRQEVGEIALAR